MSLIKYQIDISHLQNDELSRLRMEIPQRTEVSFCESLDGKTATFFLDESTDLNDLNLPPSCHPHRLYG